MTRLNKALLANIPLNGEKLFSGGVGILSLQGSWQPSVLLHEI